MNLAARPNLIVLIGEDTGCHHGCYGNQYARTPHLDALARDGIRYTHAFATSPVCAPARATMVSGIYPWSMGTHHMRTRLTRPPRLFTHELRDAGYHVAWPTKRDFNFDPDSGWADEADEELASPNWIAPLRTGKLPDQPFFLFANFFVTHESTMWPGAFGRDVGAHFYRTQLDALLGPEGKHDPAHASVPPYLPDDDGVRQNIAWYHDALTIQDAQVGQVLEALEMSPYRDTTIVLYFSDHGRGLPREKRWCYDAGLHVPLIVRGPGIDRGAVSNELISGVDLAPTILSLAGVPAPSQYQGRAFLGSASHAPPRDCCFSGRDRIGENYDHVRTARDSRWRYIRNTWPEIPYAQPNEYMDRMAATRSLRTEHARDRLSPAAAAWMSEHKPAEELYDTVADPFEVRNLAESPPSADAAAALERLRAALDDHLATVGDQGDISECELIRRGVIDNRLDTMRGARDARPRSDSAFPCVCDRDEAIALRESLQGSAGGESRGDSPL